MLSALSFDLLLELESTSRISIYAASSSTKRVLIGCAYPRWKMTHFDRSILLVWVAKWKRQSSGNSTAIWGRWIPWLLGAVIATRVVDRTSTYLKTSGSDPSGNLILLLTFKTWSQIWQTRLQGVSEPNSNFERLDSAKQFAWTFFRMGILLANCQKAWIGYN